MMISNQKIESAISVDGFPSRILDSLNAAIAVLDRHGRIVAVNRAWLQFGRENAAQESAIGVGANYLTVCESASGHDEEFAWTASVGIHEVLEGKRDSFTLEYPCHSPDQERWFALHVVPLADCPGFVVATHRSITRRKQMEKRLLESERLAAIGLAMKGLSHQGRNSLQVSQGVIDLLRTYLEDEPDAIALLDQLKRAQRKLVSLYEEVQAYAKPIVPCRSAQRLDELLLRVWDGMASEHGQCELIIDRQNPDVTCDVDPDLMGMVFRALIDNSLHANPPSTRLEVRFDVVKRRATQYVAVTLRDNGPGIALEDPDRVFEAFYTTKLHGTGLGLALARRIIETHQGELRNDSVPDSNGATFTIILPRRNCDGAVCPAVN